MSTYAVVNPATGETVKEYPEISDGELRAAIDRADQASRSWPSSTSVGERAALVRKVSELHSERRQQLAEIIVREMGKPMEQALGEVAFCADIYGFYADNGQALLADEPIELGGGYLVIGTSTDALGVSEIFVARMRPTLTFSSQENDAPLYRTLSYGRNIRGVSAAPSLTGEFGYLIIGNEVRSTGTNIWLSKINQNGNVLWSTTLGSEAENDYGAAVAQLPVPRAGGSAPSARLRRQPGDGSGHD